MSGNITHWESEEIGVLMGQLFQRLGIIPSEWPPYLPTPRPFLLLFPGWGRYYNNGLIILFSSEAKPLDL